MFSSASHSYVPTLDYIYVQNILEQQHEETVRLRTFLFCSSHF